MYAPPRSMNAALEEGMTDGKYKKVAANRGGFLETERLYADRRDLYDTWYGIHEAPVKVFPDGSRPRATVNYLETLPPDVPC